MVIKHQKVYLYIDC